MRSVFVFMAGLLLCGCSGEPAPLVAADVVLTKIRPGAEARAGYFSLTNTSGEPIVITAVSSPQFEAVEMHESVLEDGVSRMRALEKVTIAPDQTIKFEPGGRHLMLMRPTGATGTVTLHFLAGEAPLLSVTAAVGG